MKTVWKFPLASTIGMPSNAQVIQVGSQLGEAMLWAIVEPKNPSVERRFLVLGTGDPVGIPDGARYIGTAFEGPLVWHVFEVI